MELEHAQVSMFINEEQPLNHEQHSKIIAEGVDTIAHSDCRNFCKIVKVLSVQLLMDCLHKFWEWLLKTGKDVMCWEQLQMKPSHFCGVQSLKGCFCWKAKQKDLQPQPSNLLRNAPSWFHQFIHQQKKNSLKVLSEKKVISHFSTIFLPLFFSFFQSNWVPSKMDIFAPITNPTGPHWILHH